MSRIFLHPGTIRSKNDNDWHFISSKKLAKLYGVNHADCKIFKHGDRGLDKHDDDIHLFPRYDGRYKKVKN